MKAVCYFIKSRAYLVFWYRVIFNLLHEIAHFHNVVIHIQINILQKHINEFKFAPYACTVHTCSIRNSISKPITNHSEIIAWQGIIYKHTHHHQNPQKQIHALQTNADFLHLSSQQVLSC